MIFRWVTRLFITRFERRFNYDMGYAHQLLDTSQRAFLHYALTGLASAYRHGVPRDAWYAVKIVAARAEDCGPCLQLVMDMAHADGVPASVREAIWHRQEAAMNDDVKLAWRYAQAAITHAPDIGMWCEAVEQRWGRQGLTTLALSMTASRMFPMLKYALGHGQTCSAVHIEGRMLPNATPSPSPLSTMPPTAHHG